MRPCGGALAARSCCVAALAPRTRRARPMFARARNLRTPRHALTGSRSCLRHVLAGSAQAGARWRAASRSVRSCGAPCTNLSSFVPDFVPPHGVERRCVGELPEGRDSAGSALSRPRGCVGELRCAGRGRGRPCGRVAALSLTRRGRTRVRVRHLMRFSSGLARKWSFFRAGTRKTRYCPTIRTRSGAFGRICPDFTRTHRATELARAPPR